MKTRHSFTLIALLSVALLPQCDKPARTTPTATTPATTAPATPAASTSAPANVAAPAVPAPSPAGSAAVVTEGLSPSFRAVASRLELGGASFAYEESNGTMALAALLDRFMSLVPAAERKGLPP